MTTSTFIPVGDAGVGPAAGGAVVAGANLDAGTGTLGDVGGVGGDVGVGGTGMLALTGAGPGTLVLALTGVASLVAGGIAVLTGRQLMTTNDTSSPLVDLSHRVGEL